jgi:hypothetical protein
MKKINLIALVAATCCGVAMAGPFDQFKGKMKEGMYEYKMDMDMPGMPGGMGKHSTTMQHCVTAKDIEGGDWAQAQQKSNCEFKDVKVSGNNASYKMVCKGEPKMTADTKLTFRDNGFVSDMKMTMDQGGQVMNMSQHMEGRLLGPCK